MDLNNYTSQIWGFFKSKVAKIIFIFIMDDFFFFVKVCIYSKLCFINVCIGGATLNFRAFLYLKKIEIVTFIAIFLRINQKVTTAQSWECFQNVCVCAHIQTAEPVINEPFYIALH